MGIVEQARETLDRATRRPSAYGALAVNLVPIFGVLFWGWSAPALMFLYWIENVVVGLANAVRIVASGAAHGKAGMASSLFLIPFFAFHYGLFCFVHGIFVLLMFGGGGLQGAATTVIGEPFEIHKIAQAMIAAQPTMIPGLWAIGLWQMVQLGLYLGGGGFRRVDPFSQMFAPYGRIIILHITIMGAGLLVMFLGQPLIGVLLLALLKTGFDVNHEAQDKDAARAREGWEKLQAEAERALGPKP